MGRLALGVAAVLALGVLPGCVSPENAPAVSRFDDENIEKDAIGRINTLHTGKVRVNVTSFNRRLLLTGEVPNGSSREEIERIVSGVAKVRAVSNELVIGDIIGISPRTTDSWITSDVKFSFRKSREIHANDIRVTTENGTVFLMGTVRRREGAAAADLASTTNRVQRVVLLFDYLD